MKLKIRDGQKLTLNRGKLSFKIKEEVFVLPFTKSTFEHFEPQLSFDTVNKSLTISNYSELKQIVGNDVSYDNVKLQLGLVIAKHHRSKSRTKLQDLIVNDLQPLNASVCWGGTPVGLPNNELLADKKAYNYLKFSVNESTGEISFINKEGNPVKLSDYIFPVTDKDSVLYRGQDGKEHQYYFIGVVFRYRFTSCFKAACKTKYSPKCIRVTYETGVGVKTELVDTGYKIKVKSHRSADKNNN